VTPGHGLESFSEQHLKLAGGGSLRYFAAGEGRAVLLVHGLGGSALNWVAVAPSLAERHRVIVPDLPGHGRSAALSRGEGLSGLADALAELIGYDRRGPALVVGHSLGGFVGLRLAVRHPDLVDGLLLAAAAGISSSRRTARYALEILGVLRPGRRLAPHRARIASSSRLRGIVFRWWGASDPSQLSPAAVDGFLAGWEMHTDTLSAARAMVSDDSRHDLGQVTCPCLVLWGACDNQVGVGDGFDYARRLDAPLRLVPDCGHLLIAERPDAVFDAIDALLDRIGQVDELPVEPKVLGQPRR
jgi:pimeloyl-ACP methyl ester carboxylesterase